MNVRLVHISVITILVFVQIQKDLTHAHVHLGMKVMVSESLRGVMAVRTSTNVIRVQTIAIQMLHVKTRMVALNVLVMMDSMVMELKEPAPI